MPGNLENTPPAEQKKSYSNSFRMGVEIKGLPFVFEGQIPKTPDAFKWLVSVPNVNEQSAIINALIRAGTIDNVAMKWLKSHGLGDGKVGKVDVVEVEPEDEMPSIGITMIETNTDYLPKEFGYQGAEGIGSFLLDNLCEMADIKGWRIYLEPFDRGGKLHQHDLYEWYKRKGFKDDYELPQVTRHEFGGMQRWPREPELSQPIVKLLPNHP